MKIQNCYFPFGPHKGKPVSEIPTGYLTGIVKWPKLSSKTKSICEYELNRRAIEAAKAADAHNTQEELKNALGEAIP